MNYVLVYFRDTQEKLYWLVHPLWKPLGLKKKRLALKRKKAANIKRGSTISTNHLFIQQKRGESFLACRSPRLGLLSSRPFCQAIKNKKLHLGDEEPQSKNATVPFMCSELGHVRASCLHLPLMSVLIVKATWNMPLSCPSHFGRPQPGELHAWAQWVNDDCRGSALLRTWDWIQQFDINHVACVVRSITHPLE